MNELEIVKKMDILRNQWKTSCGVDREVLRIRGVMLKIALEKKLKKSPAQQTI